MDLVREIVEQINDVTVFFAVAAYATLCYVLLYRSYRSPDFGSVLRVLSLMCGFFVFTTIANHTRPDMVWLWRFLARLLVFLAAYRAYRYWWADRGKL